MQKIIVYGSMKCPDCLPAIQLLKKNNIPFSFVEILQDIVSLKEFLAIRDNQDELSFAKQNGTVGIPCIYWQERKKYYTDCEIFLKDFLI